VREEAKRRHAHSPRGTPVGRAAQAREMVQLKQQVESLSARLTASEADAAATRTSMEAAQQREARCV
jgi:hypothetical protein